MYKRIVAFGEIMLRLNTPAHQRLLQATTFESSYAGSEANTAAMLARLGSEAYFVTKLPANLIGEAAISFLRKHNIKTDHIIHGGKRLGIYFLEHGYSQRGSQVIYDRADSAIAESKSDEYNWNKIFNEIDWFHFSGITPALSENTAATTHEAVKQAKDAGIMVSCDLNYRKSLWNSEKACSVLSELMPFVDLCIGNEEDTEIIFGIKPSKTDIKKGILDKSGYTELAYKMIDKFGFKYVATSLRESYSATRNGWSAMLSDGTKTYFSKKYDIDIIDRVGAGDSFAGALIYSLLEKDDYQESVEFAAAASCLKHTIPGDFNLVSHEEIEKLVQGDQSGRVSR